VTRRLGGRELDYDAGSTVDISSTKEMTHMPVLPAVRNASKAFYAALNAMLAGDAGPMSAIWSHTTASTTMHPIGGCERGWRKVKGPWGQIATMCQGGSVKLRSAKIHATRDMAVESGVETGTLTLAGATLTIEHRVTNVYVREGRTWKIVHHHADPSAEMIAVLKKLQATGA
jgi:ketosteroid isomerase-like protein